MVTPGTLTDSALLDDKRDNVLLALHLNRSTAGLAWLSLASGRFTAMETAAAVRGLRPWITNEYLHNGLSVDDRVFTRLLDMVRGRA